MNNHYNRESRREHPGRVKVRERTTKRKKVGTRFRGRGKYRDMPVARKIRHSTWRLYEFLYGRRKALNNV